MQEATTLDNYTYQDYCDIDKNAQERIELIFGKIYMMAGASAALQDTVGNIFFELKSISKDKAKCLPRIAPFDLKLIVDKEKHVVQPDVMLFCEDDIPCVIFEVLSPSTAYKDKTVKKELYEKNGIREYFLVDVDFKIIEKFMLIEGQYQYIGAYGIEDTLIVECIGGEIEVKQLFEA